MSAAADTDALPLCACGEFYQSHHPECPARKAYEQAAAALRAQQERIAELSKFFDKYGLGPMMKPSCLCCGRNDYSDIAVQHMELPGIVICKGCKAAADRAEQAEAALAAEKDHSKSMTEDRDAFQALYQAEKARGERMRELLREWLDAYGGTGQLLRDTQAALAKESAS